ncbi:MAG: transglutaminase family protein [bacterium]|nr:transglutaminase family protein [bacterium]
MKNTLETYLQATKYCDSDNQDIIDLSHEVTAACSTPQEKAVKLFYWVRDNIYYRVGLWNKSASETLHEKYGTCTNKSNLLTAMLRASNIPAGFGLMTVKGQSYLGPIAIPRLRKYIGKRSTHVYSVVYLDKWIKIDASDDYEFCKKISHFNPTSELVDWDGIHDAELNIKKKDIIDEIFPLQNIKYLIEKKAVNAQGVKLTIANRLISFARKNTIPVKDAAEFEEQFMKYLRRYHPLEYYLFYFWDLYYNFRNKK